MFDITDLAVFAPHAPATRRCLSACAAADHIHAERLRRQCDNTRWHHNPRHTQRTLLESKRVEAGVRDMRTELRA